ncbi:Rhodanese-like domain-containing protein [Crepidotus variabilis]|uniref:Rhodanese-like domain-containing protein n=1 Tax=Crepidotus variabilis TaxID=179855 RepID=A0A9P6ESX5_9AGAR|nr:Rhodanese-like domain-containing protein [Crepidotus variabilis]
MLRIAAAKAIRPAFTNLFSQTIYRSLNRTTASATYQSVRWNSKVADTSADSAKTTKKVLTPQEAAKKAALEKRDDLQRDWDAKVLSYEEFLPKTQNPSANAYIIDVREPDEVIQGMIPGAVNLPLSVMSGALHLPHQEFKDKFGFEKPRKNQEVVFYCRSGMRSSTAADVAKRNGWDTNKILNYKGSWLEWTAKQNEKQ